MGIAKRVAIYVIIFFLGFFATYLSLNASKIFVKNPFRNIIPTPNAYSQATPRPIDQIEPDQQEKGTYNILLLGHGGTGHPGGLLTDSIIVARVNINSKKVSFITIPRDLWVDGNKKINATGITDFADIAPVATSVTGLPINYFAAVDFNGLVKIVDLLGGITVNTPSAFKDPFFPIKGEENNLCGKSEAEVNELKAKYSGYNLETQFTCRYESIEYAAGLAELNGAQALKYVRSRHGDSDFGRSARQGAVLGGIAKKLISIQAAGKFDEIINTLSSIVKTDLDAGTIKSLVQLAVEPDNYSYNTIQLTTDNVLNSSKSADGQFILVPKAGDLNFTGIRSYIKDNIN